MLTIAEELFLLALNHRRGWMHFRSSVSLAPALAGAVLFDLAFDEIISVEDKKVKLEEKPLSEVKMISDTIKYLDRSRGHKTIKHWVRKFSSRKYNLKERVVDELESRGILRQKEIVIARYLPIKKLLLKDESIKIDIIAKLNKSLETESFEQARVASLFILVVACGLEKIVFGKRKASKAKEVARWLQMDDQIAVAVSEIVDELTVLLFVAKTASSAA